MEEKRPMSSPKKKPEKPHAMAFFDGAIAYQIAANKLREIMNSQPPSGLPLRDPTYFLYHHSVELGLKAWVLSHGESIEKHHDIATLFEKCRTKGFLKIRDEHRELHNAIVLLGADNRGLGYRYAESNEHIIPDLDWVHEVVERLILEVIRPDVETWAKNNNVPGPSKIRLTFGKPTYKKQAVPLKPGP
jgi:HEPN domain-containing protein